MKKHDGIRVRGHIPISWTRHGDDEELVPIEKASLAQLREAEGRIRDQAQRLNEEADAILFYANNRSRGTP